MSPDSAAASKTGFDNEAYIKEQTTSILERVERFQEKLYLEFGGKIMKELSMMVQLIYL